jgi:Mg2+/citrate symporter
MGGIPDQVEMQRRVGQQLLGPFEDAISLAHRYREVDAFHDYIGERARLVIPALALIGVTGVACGLAPVMALVGTSATSALAGLLLMPLMLIGSLFVLGLVFLSWLEERSLARTLGRRTAREAKAMRWMRKKLGADLGRAPRVPWLLAALFVALPFAMLLNVVPSIAAILLALLVAAPVAFARLDR